MKIDLNDQQIKNVTRGAYRAMKQLPKNGAERQAKSDEKKRRAGLTRLQVWVRLDQAAAIRAYIEKTKN